MNEIGIALTGLAHPGNVILDEVNRQGIIACRGCLEEFNFGIHVYGITNFGTAKGDTGFDIGRGGRDDAVYRRGPSAGAL